MAKANSTAELDKTLFILEQNFLKELRRITDQRLKLEKYYTSSTILPAKSSVCKSKEVKQDFKTSFTVRLEPSLGETLAKSRGSADELEDKLQKTRKAFDDKLQTLGRIQKELDRREKVLVNSIGEIEAYIRAIFFLKQKADHMYLELKKVAEQNDKTAKEIAQRFNNWKVRKHSVLKAAHSFQMAKSNLKKILPDLEKYATVKDLVGYYLVLKELQRDILSHEEESDKAQTKVAVEMKQVMEYQKRAPLIQMSKDAAIFELKTKLWDMRKEISQLNEQIDIAILSKLKDDAAWYEIQRWIKGIFVSCIEIRPPGPHESTTGYLNMLDRIKDFVTDAREMVKRLKKGK